VDSGVSLTVGDVLLCSAEGALSYRWSNLHNRNSAKIYGQSLVISQPGRFNYKCSVFMKCAAGTFCPFTRTIAGFAKGICISFCGFNRNGKITVGLNEMRNIVGLQSQYRTSFLRATAYML